MTAAVRSGAIGSQLVKYFKRGQNSRVGVIELSNPSKRNALSLSTLGQLLDVIKKVESDESIRVVVLQAQGPAFSSGHDLSEIRHLQNEANEESGYRGEQTSKEKLSDLFSLCSNVMTSIVESTKPYVAKVDGVATAAGCQLVASCDLAYASTGSKFATPGVNIGLFCSTPAVALGRTVHRKAAMDMLLTGRLISAKEAAGIGLINEALAVESLDDRVDEISELIATKSPMAISTGKPVVAAQLGLPLHEAYGIASKCMVDGSLREDCIEGIDAFLSKRIPVWRDGTKK
mmetsp:Transcript_15611/g.21345  ORF Transcript_15611/g.21345 Transcript_15611/m.21345 type:complete len:289 (-) Transcript_15611:419-1285(-)